MQVQLTKWGNSVAVRLPKAMLASARLEAGDLVELEVPAAGSILVRRKRGGPVIEDLIAKITPENVHPETEWGPQRGNEVW